MRIHKFEGATIRDAIAKVKAKLGDQAVIISTRQIRQGLLGSATEISAAVDDDHVAQDDGPIGPVPGVSAPAPQHRDVEKLIEPLRTELRSLRAMVRTSGEGRSTELRSEVAALRRLVEELRKQEDAKRDDEAARKPRSRRKTDRTPRRKADDIPLVRTSTSRSIMLVGPTGAGKTTTIAKLAARAALIDDKRVKLITLDNYRVGGVDQIQTFADLIGVPLHVAETPGALAGLLDDDYDLVLIDTAGRSPRDIASIDDLARELPDLPPIEIHLVIPAASSPEAIDELAGRYRRLGPARLLFTKLDEVERCAELSRAPSRTNLSITWITMGQNVPEDIEEPTAARVLDVASNGIVASRATLRAAEQPAPTYWQSRQDAERAA